MKANYISPDIELAYIQPVRLMANSLPVNNNQSDDEIENESEFLSRRRNDVWEDEEEEEDF